MLNGAHAAIYDPMGVCVTASVGVNLMIIAISLYCYLKETNADMRLYKYVR